MSDVVEPEVFSEDVDRFLQTIVSHCEGKNVDVVVNVLANALIIVVKSTGTDLERLRTFMDTMIDTHIAVGRQENTEKS